MFDFKEMYENMNNPIMNDNLISVLLDFYGKEMPIYDALTIWYTKGLGVKEGIKGNVLEAKDKLFATLFNVWKHNFANLSDVDIYKMCEKEQKDIQELLILRRTLQHLPDISSYKEYQDYIHNNALISKYGWQNTNDFSSFVRIKSDRFALDTEFLGEIDHRLYINLDSREIESIVLLFIDNCFKRKIPFYLKYDSNADRDDSLVIYSDTVHLASYINILKTIKEQYSGIRVYYPPVITGRIDEWIGYGAEPNKNDSFHGKRSEVIKEGIINSLISWVNLHRETLIDVNGKSIKVQDFVVDNIINKIFIRIKDEIETYKGMGNNFYFNKCGLNESDITSSYLFKIIFNFVMYVITNLNDNNFSCDYDMPTRDGKSIRVYKNEFLSSYRELIPAIMKMDSHFINEVQECILRVGAKKGIDKNNFSFDVDKRDKLFRYQEELEQRKKS